MIADNQVEALDHQLPRPAPEDPNKPRMPFKTALILTREQEDAMLNHALLRREQIGYQLGKNTDGSGNHKLRTGDFPITCRPDSFYGKREKYTARYYNHVEDRPLTLPSPNIYEESNVTASLSQRIVRQMIAKSTRYFFGRPDDHEWFTNEAVGVEDPPLAEKIKKFARFKAQQCEVKPRLVQSTEFAWVRGECVVKITHLEQFQIFKRTATILVQSEDPKSEPILDAFGDYITSTDAVVDEMQEVAVEASQVPVEAGVTPQQQGNSDPTAVTTVPVSTLEPTGRKLLKRDGVTVIPDSPIWRTEVITKRNVTFEGPDVSACYFLDFGAPLNAPGLQPGEADFIYHDYDRTLMKVAQMFGDQYAEGDAGIAEFNNAVELLRNMISAGNQPKAAAQQPRSDFGEQDTDNSINNPTSLFAECWFTYDADNDGVEEEIMMVVDVRNRAPIYYEYTANVTLRGNRPFEQERAMPVADRWWGMGGMEYFDPEQEFIDLLINRKNFREGGSGRVTFWAPWCTVEGERNPKLQLNHGGTYTLRENYKAEDALSYITLPEDTTDLKEMIDLYMQFMQMKGGVLTGADRAVSNLPSSETLGEEELITQSGDELFELFLVNLYLGLSRILNAMNDVIFSNINRRLVFTYFNGQATEILELTPDDVRDLPIHVRLSITQSEDRKVLESGNVTDDIVDRFYQRDFDLQQRLAPYARARLKALKVPQADTIIEPRETLPALPADPAAGGPTL